MRAQILHQAARKIIAIPACKVKYVWDRLVLTVPIPGVFWIGAIGVNMTTSIKGKRSMNSTPPRRERRDSDPAEQSDSPLPNDDVGNGPDFDFDHEITDREPSQPYPSDPESNL